MRIRHWIAWGLLVLVILGIGGVAFGFRAAGYEKYVVQTGSMSPGIMPGDLVIDRLPASGYTVGDVITFQHSDSPDIVTHRIVQIAEDGIKTKGDANPTPDVWTIPPALVKGVVAFVIPKGGYVVLFLSQPSGIASVLVVIVALVLLWRLFFPNDPVPDTPDPEATTDPAGPDNPVTEALAADDSATADLGSYGGAIAPTSAAETPDLDAPEPASADVTHVPAVDDPASANLGSYDAAPGAAHGLSERVASDPAGSAPEVADASADVSLVAAGADGQAMPTGDGPGELPEWPLQPRAASRHRAD